MAEDFKTLKRMPTGIDGLDELLGGGVLVGRSTLIKGPPGSGKTTFGLQSLVEGARTHGEPGIMLSFEMIPAQLVADGTAMGWDLNGLALNAMLKVFFVSPQEILEKPTRQEHRLLALIEEWAGQTSARRILIDSLSHIRQLYEGGEARALFLDFIMQLKQLGLTPFMTAERSGEDGRTEIDAYLADNVILLDYHPAGLGSPDRREVEVLKTRGHQHISGAHPFEITESGIVVYPHSYPEIDAPEPLDELPPAQPEPLKSGVHGMDDLLAGGYVPGSSVLVTGLSGTCKTTLAMHFLLANATTEKPGVWLTFQESQSELEEVFGCIDLDLRNAVREKRIFVREYIPGRDPVEKIVAEAEAMIDSTGATCIAIDSLDKMVGAIRGEAERRETVQWALRRLRRKKQTVFVTELLTKVVGRNPLSEIGWADLTDTLVYLGLVEIESRLEKVVSVLKHRGGQTSGDLRSIRCTPSGLEVSDRLVGLSGLLDGAAQGQRKKQIETIFQPLYFVRDFLLLAKDPELEAAKRESILNNLSQQTNKLIAQLSEYFDQPVRPNPSDKKDSP